MFIFNVINTVEYILSVLGETGIIGGTISHEYQFKTPLGEDQLVICSNCNFAGNVEACKSITCPKCTEEVKLELHSGIEVTCNFYIKYNRIMDIL